LVSDSDRLLSIGLRSATLGTRFLFIFFLAKYLDPASVGYYGIFTATVGYALYFVGLDFYTYISREIVKTPLDQRGKLLKSQASLAGILYLLLLPIAIALLVQAGWPEHLVWWFLPILVLEHFNQEMFRLLIVLSEQLTASLILFIRQGSWALAIIALMVLDTDARNLDAVMALWATAGVLAAATAVWKFKRLQITGWALPIDWNWVKKGLAVSSAFLLATLALRGVQTFDRYWLEALGGIELVGAYVLLLGVAGTLLTFLDAAVFSFAYPALIQHSHKGEHQVARKKVKLLLIQTLVISAFFGVISWFLLPYFLDWIGNPVYQNHIHWYPWLLSAMTINAVGLVPHFALYARGEDKPIIYSHVAGLLTFCGLTWAISGRYSALAVPIGLNAAFVVILVIKSFFYCTLIKKNILKPMPFQG
jgi:O-antigen/teichoic acid export membrane protein